MTQGCQALGDPLTITAAEGNRSSESKAVPRSRRSTARSRICATRDSAR